MHVPSRGGAETCAAAATTPGLSHSWWEAISLGVETTKLKSYPPYMLKCKWARFLKHKAMP